MKPKRIKIVFVLPSLTAGGAERVVSFISQNLDKNRFHSHLVITGFNKNSAYSVDGVEVIFLNKKRVLKAIPALTWFLYKHRPDIVMGSIGHVNIVLGLVAPLVPKAKIVARIASVSSEIAKFSPSNRLYSLLAKISTQNIDHFICQSQDMKADFIKSSPKIRPEKVSIINNPITRTFTLKQPGNDGNTIKQFITIGRLSNEKGHDRILEVLAKYEEPFHYTMIGEGPLKDKIFQQISSLGLSENISFINFTKDVEKYLSKSDLFLQGSYVEGFPNAVLESCAVGTPVLAFNVPGGTKEIIEHGVNGYLATTEEEYLKYLYLDKEWDESKISESVVHRFNSDKIIEQYENLFLKIIGING